MNTRREFLQTLAYSGLGVTMLPIAMGAGGITNIAENVIYLYMDGGMSHLDTFDPKTNQEVRCKLGFWRQEFRISR